MLKDLFSDDNGNISSMRVSYIICMVLSSMLVMSSIYLAFHSIEYSSLISASIAFAGIGTAGKAAQKFKE